MVILNPYFLLEMIEFDEYVSHGLETVKVTSCIQSTRLTRLTLHSWQIKVERLGFWILQKCDWNPGGDWNPWGGRFLQV